MRLRRGRETIHRDRPSVHGHANFGGLEVQDGKAVAAPNEELDPDQTHLDVLPIDLRLDGGHGEQKEQGRRDRGPLRQRTAHHRQAVLRTPVGGAGFSGLSDS